MNVACDRFPHSKHKLGHKPQPNAGSMVASVPSKLFELGAILPKLKIRRVLAPKSLASAENWPSFALILTKPVEPIFQSAGPLFGAIQI